MNYYLYAERDGEVEFLAEAEDYNSFTDYIESLDEAGLYEGCDYKAINVVTRQEYMYTGKWEQL